MNEKKELNEGKEEINFHVNWAIKKNLIGCHEK